MPQKLLFVTANDQYFCSHRLSLAIAAQKAGFIVAVATQINHHKNLIEAYGIKIFNLRFLHRSSMQPLKEIAALYELFTIYRDFKPNIVHHVAMKPVMYGALMAKCCRVPKTINALTGLGYLFTSANNTKQSFMQNYKRKIIRYIVCKLFAYLLNDKNSKTIFQNPDDIQTLLHHGCINVKQAVLIRGSGVDPTIFRPVAFKTTFPVHCIFAARMLWDKGVGELIEAIRIIKQHNKDAQFYFYGTPDLANPASIPESSLIAWQKQGLIVWQGYQADMINAYKDAHIAILPSYREGLPKFLLEAASCGLPLIATDVAGCREIVHDGKNGFLVPLQDVNTLAEKILILINNEALRISMGQHSRWLVETQFADTIIHKTILELYL